MSITSSDLNTALAKCHYDSAAKIKFFQEILSISQTHDSLKLKTTQMKQGHTHYTVLELYGTIPVMFSNAIYNIPIKIQYPVGYPNYAPVFIVTPSADMEIKPSEFVQEDGRVTLDILNK